MSNEEAELEYKKFLLMFPNHPSPVHYPKSFAYYVKLYKFLKGKQNVK